MLREIRTRKRKYEMKQLDDDVSPPHAPAFYKTI